MVAVARQANLPEDGDVKRTPLKRAKPMAKASRPIARKAKVKARNRKRHSREWVRAYGSQDRVKFVKSLPCVVTGCGNAPSENMHTGTGGAGRKGDADTIVPACAEHHRFAHQHGIQTFVRSFPLPESLMVLASRTERLYQAYADGGWDDVLGMANA